MQYINVSKERRLVVVNRKKVFLAPGQIINLTNLDASMLGMSAIYVTPLTAENKPKPKPVAIPVAKPAVEKSVPKKSAPKKAAKKPAPKKPAPKPAPKKSAPKKSEAKKSTSKKSKKSSKKKK